MIALMSQKTGMKMPLNITQWPLRIGISPSVSSITR